MHKTVSKDKLIRLPVIKVHNTLIKSMINYNKSKLLKEFHKFLKCNQILSPKKLTRKLFEGGSNKLSITLQNIHKTYLNEDNKYNL